MSSCKKIKLLAFDLDGVLVDACNWHYHSLNKALKQVTGYYEIAWNAHVDTFNGLPTKTKLKMLCDMNIISADMIPKIWKLKQEYTIEIIREHGSLDNQKISMLKQLKFEGFQLACVTNSIEETAKLMLSVTGQLEYFDLLIHNEKVKNPKPDPEGYILAMKEFGVTPFETLIIEDSIKGKRAAYASNAYVLEVSDPSEVTYENITQCLHIMN